MFASTTEAEWEKYEGWLREAEDGMLDRVEETRDYDLGIKQVMVTIRVKVGGRWRGFVVTFGNIGKAEAWLDEHGRGLKTPKAVVVREPSVEMILDGWLPS